MPWRPGKTLQDRVGAAPPPALENRSKVQRYTGESRWTTPGIRKNDPPEKAIDGLLSHSLRRALDPAGPACPDAEILAAYCEHSLSRPETSRWEAHFATCSRCQAQLAGVVRSAEAGAVVGGEGVVSGELGMVVELAGAGPRRQRRGRRPCALGRRSRLARGSVTVTGNSVWRTGSGCAGSFCSRSRGTGAECGGHSSRAGTRCPSAWSSTRRHGRRLQPSRRVPVHDVHNKPTKRQALHRQHQTETRRKCRASYPRSLSSARSASRRRRQPPRERMISCPTVLFRPTPFERAGPLRPRRTGPFSLA